MPQSPQPIVERLACVFRKRFSRSPEAAGISPGRVEILGNHTDYNGGCVLTSTIDRYIVAVGARRSDRAVRVFAEAFDEEATLDAAGLTHVPQHRWPDYVAAAITGANNAAKNGGASPRPNDCSLPGMDIVVGGDLPIGAGLSSSAATEASLARLLLHAGDVACAPLPLAEALQAGEAQCAGVQCGLLDQYTVLCGDADTLLVFDSDARRSENIAFGAVPMAFIIIEPHVPRELGGDAPYNRRRSECDAAAARLATILGRAQPPLCAAAFADYRRARRSLPELLRSRSRHVVLEHQRAMRAVECLNRGDLARFGRLLNASHRSSVRHFENSLPVLDRVQQVVSAVPGCLGCRLSGAGWGGCLLAVTKADDAAAVAERLRRAFAEASDLRGVGVSPCQSADAAHAFAL